jgi:hypothetical protein
MNATPDKAGVSSSESDRAGLENIIRKFVVRDFDLHARVENLEAWSEVFMSAIESLGLRAEPLLTELEDARKLYQRPEWSDGKNPRDNGRQLRKSAGNRNMRSAE